MLPALDTCAAANGFFPSFLQEFFPPFFSLRHARDFTPTTLRTGSLQNERLLHGHPARRFVQVLSILALRQLLISFLLIGFTYRRQLARGLLNHILLSNFRRLLQLQTPRGLRAIKKQRIPNGDLIQCYKTGGGGGSKPQT